MQIKTVKKNIENKMEDWLSTIIETPDNKNLRSRIRKNILVSGGSITSMLLNEEVNDYDVYIQDMDVLLELVKYYTQNFSDITVLDGRKRNEYLSQWRKEGIYKIAIDNLKPDQVKLFFEDRTGGKRVEGVLKDSPNYVPLFFSPNAISLSNNIQIITRFNGDAEAIHKTFDYIHATNYFTFEEGLVTNKEALESILTKQLKYQGSLYPLTSILRMKKFIKRNWNINAGEVLKIMFQISELNLKDPNVLEDQLIGIDVAYFSKLIEILRDTPDEKITSHYINTVIDRVFDASTDETGI